MFFKTVLLRHNSQSEQFIHLKYIIQWLLSVYSQSSASIITINFRMYSFLQEETPYYSLSITSQSHQSTGPRQLLIYFLSLYMYLFCTFHINGIMQCTVLCIWFLSLSIMFISVVACIRTSSFYCPIIFHCVEYQILFT